MKTEAIALVIVVLTIGVGALTYFAWRWLSVALWRWARENAQWFTREPVQPDGSVWVVVQREAHLGWACEVIGEPVLVETVSLANVEAGMLQEARARADILASNYNRLD
jgi:hypothetical protein